MPSDGAQLDHDDVGERKLAQHVFQSCRSIGELVLKLAQEFVQFAILVKGVEESHDV